MNRHFQTYLMTGLFWAATAIGASAQNVPAAGDPYNPYGQNYPTATYPVQYAYPTATAGATTPGMQPVMMQPVMLQQMPQAPQEILDTNTSTYTLGPSDIVEIVVARHPEVSGTYVVNQEGKIQYEFVGDVEVKGLTKNSLKDLLIEKLSEYIISPDVTVKISGYNSKVVFIVGEVGSPGKLIMKGDTITVQEAVVQAGLPLHSGKIKDAVIVTPSNDGEYITRKVNLAKLLYKGDMRENLIMQPGDTLYIKATFLTKTMRAMSPVAAPISTAAGTSQNVRGGFVTGP